MAVLSQAQAVALLQKLGSDPAFHASFSKDPAAALAQLGLPAEFARCCAKVKLASPDVIKASQKQLINDLTAHGVQTVIGLNAT